MSNKNKLKSYRKVFSRTVKQKNELDIGGKIGDV